MASQNPTLNTAERAMPQALEVERAVLGAMLIDNMAINRVVEVLGDETAFYHTPHRKVYAAIQKLSERGEPVDQVTLTEELLRRGQLDDVGGAVLIAELASEMATAANAEYHAQIVLEEAQRRRLIAAATQTITESYDKTEDVRELIDRAEQRVFQIAEGELGKGVMPLISALTEAYEAIDRAREQRGTLTGVTTGYTEDDTPAISVMELRESGSLEQDADVVMFLFRPEVYGIVDEEGNTQEGEAEIILGKQRNGPIGSVFLTFLSECLCFEEPEIYREFP